MSWDSRVATPEGSYYEQSVSSPVVGEYIWAECLTTAAYWPTGDSDEKQLEHNEVHIS